MPKAMIEYDLDTEYGDFKLATNAKDIMMVLWEIDQELRTNIKYAPDSVSTETVEALTNIRDKLYDFMSDRNISFNMIE